MRLFDLFAEALPLRLLAHRELPQGRFERRIALPPGVYGEVRRFEANGCLVVTLAKAGMRRQP